MPFPDIFTYIPDIRLQRDTIIAPPHTRKSAILGPKKEPRDFLINLYFAKPDYEDSHLKAYYSANLGCRIGLFFGFFAVGSHKNMRNPKVAIALLAQNLAFGLGSTLTYGSVATIAANVRGKKDDVFNHAAAGASLGLIAGFTYRSSGAGCFIGFLAALAGMMLKQWHLDGRTMKIEEINRNRHHNFVDGGEETDYRVPSYYLNVRDNKRRIERYY